MFKPIRMKEQLGTMRSGFFSQTNKGTKLFLRFYIQSPSKRVSLAGVVGRYQ